ncbi:undecaprenyl/decaprenyl-phosphate alpha-N-acetylglucosaminyl 1-phosphate transferase [Candidatus Woesebacteria bacterium]|nr:undecaprenyl/decaprenyl-phosphate alpha-N-acetylglucosaminyl 1-phosphate transferase [Candidatus Woesebacteria bacterium]
MPGLVALIASFLATPLVIKLAWKAGIIDDPTKNKHIKVIHTYPVPRGGGLALFFAILFASLIFLPLDKHLKGILGGAAVLTLMGILDDKYNLNPYIRLAGGFLAAGIPIAAGIGIAFLSNPAGGIIDLSQPQINFYFLGEQRSIWVLSDAFALIWIVFVMNMLNMGAKGVDGQLPGVVVVAASTIAALSLKFSADIAQWPVIILAAITAGAYLGFLPWNFYPQKIMPGYAGSTLAGYLLAVLSILSTTKVGTLIVVLGIPLIDTGYTIVRRILARKSPVWGDRGHLHHRLLDLGWGKRRVAVFYWAISAFLGFLALNLNTSSKLYTMVGIAILLGGLILWLTYRPKS